MKTAFKVPVGYSDHTIGNTVSNAAIALGAHLIEKHFTIDTKLEGPDHVLSMDPEGLRTLTKERNVIMTALGDGIKRIMPSEYLQINNQRKSIFSNRDITKGEKIGIDDVVIKGPGHGIMPKYVDLVVNTIAKSNIKKDQPITWNDILEK